MYLITINLDRFCAVAVLENKDDVRELLAGRGTCETDEVVVKWNKIKEVTWDGDDVYYGEAMIEKEIDAPYYEPYHLEAFPLPIAGGIVTISD